MFLSVQLTAVFVLHVAAVLLSHSERICSVLSPFSDTNLNTLSICLFRSSKKNCHSDVWGPPYVLQ